MKQLELPFRVIEGKKYSKTVFSVVQERKLSSYNYNGTFEIHFSSPETWGFSSIARVDLDEDLHEDEWMEVWSPNQLTSQHSSTGLQIVHELMLQQSNDQTVLIIKDTDKELDSQILLGELQILVDGILSEQGTAFVEDLKRILAYELSIATTLKSETGLRHSFHVSKKEFQPVQYRAKTPQYANSPKPHVILEELM